MRRGYVKLDGLLVFCGEWFDGLLGIGGCGEIMRSVHTRGNFALDLVRVVDC